MIRSARGLVATGVLVVCALVGAALGGNASVAAAATASTTTAVVVIDFSAFGGPVRTEIVDVGNGMSGLAVLSHVATVISYGYAGQGGAVCKIDGEGNDATASTCLVGPNSQYWAYFHSANGATTWSYSPVGAGGYTVHGGDVEGWRYGTGQKPGASPNFCDYASCPEPPPPTTPAGSDGGGQGTPSGGGGGGAGDTGTGGSTGSGTGTGTGTGAATGTGGPGGTGSASGTSDGATSDPPQPTTTTLVPTSDGRGNAASGKDGDDLRAEATSLSRGGSDDGSGSPMGVVIAAGLLAIVAATAIWLRRRARAPG